MILKLPRLNYWLFLEPIEVFKTLHGNAVHCQLSGDGNLHGLLCVKPQQPLQNHPSGHLEDRRNCGWQKKC